MCGGGGLEITKSMLGKCHLVFRVAAVMVWGNRRLPKSGGGNDIIPVGEQTTIH